MVSVKQPAEITGRLLGEAETDDIHDKLTYMDKLQQREQEPGDTIGTEEQHCSSPRTGTMGSSSMTASVPSECDEADSSSHGSDVASAAAASSALSMADLLKLCHLNQRQIQEVEEKLLALLTKQHALVQARGTAEVNSIIHALSAPLGFHTTRPVAALLLYRSLLYWGVLQLPTPAPLTPTPAPAPEPPSTASSTAFHEEVLARILDAITEQLHADDPASSGGRRSSRQERMTHLATWLSNLATLLYMVSRCLPTAPRANPQPGPVDPLDPRPTLPSMSRVLEGLGRRMISLMSTPPEPECRSPRSAMMSPLSPASSGPLPGSPSSTTSSYRTAPDLTPDARPIPRTSSSTPADEPSPFAQHQTPVAGAFSHSASVAAFRSNLERLLQEAYRKLREVAYRHLGACLEGCMLDPHDTSRGSYTLEEAADYPPGTDPHLLPWLDLVAALKEVVGVLQAAHLPRPVVHGLMAQLVGHIDTQLFNQLLLRPECCSTSNARFIIEGLGKVDAWLHEAGPQELGSGIRDSLPHIRQAATLLLLENKAQLSLSDLTAHLCPALTAQQLYRLCTTSWNDAGETEMVSGEVLEALKGRVPNNGGLIVTFTLEDDLAVPMMANGRVAVEAICPCSEKELLQGVPVPAVLLEGGVPADIYAYLEEDLHPTYATPTRERSVTPPPPPARSLSRGLTTPRTLMTPRGLITPRNR